MLDIVFKAALGQGTTVATAAVHLADGRSLGDFRVEWPTQGSQLIVVSPDSMRLPDGMSEADVHLAILQACAWHDR
jgi:hypothetical protein